MLPSVDWLAVIVAAAAGFAISMIFYSLPVMQRQRSQEAAANKSQSEIGGRSKSLFSEISQRLLNTFLYAYAFEWLITQTGISTLGMGILLVFVGMLRAAFTPEGWNRDMIAQPRNVRLVDNARFILMYIVMVGILLFWR